MATTAQAGLDDPKLSTESVLLAENEQLRLKCAKLEQQVKSHESDIKVIDGLCDVFKNEADDFQIGGQIFSPPPSPYFGVSDPSPLQQRSSSINSFCGILDSNAFFDDLPSVPTTPDLCFPDDFVEYLPSLGRSISSSWAASVGTPRSCALEKPPATDENQNANANIMAPPPMCSLSKNITSIDCSLLNNTTSIDSMDVFDTYAPPSESTPRIPAPPPQSTPRIPTVSKPFLIESPRPKRRKNMSKEVSTNQLHTPLPLRAPPVTPSSPHGAKENKSWDIVLSPEQRYKHENWVHKKRRRVKYGTKYVYTNKRDIARSRTRSDGKFQKTQERELVPTVPKTTVSKTTVSKRRKYC